MSKWKTGKEIIDEKGLKHFEFLNEYVRKGLTPHNQLGKAISPYEVIDKITNINGLRKEIENIKIHFSQLSEDLSRDDIEQSFYESTVPVEQEIEIAERRLSDVKDKDWNGVDLPQSEKESLEILTELADSLYLVDSMEKTIPNKISLPDQNQSDRGDVKARKLTPNQKHKIASRAVAEKLRKEDPNITIAACINHQEIIDACSGKIYLEKTIRDWIKDLWPPEKRQPGRPKKKPE